MPVSNIFGGGMLLQRRKRLHDPLHVAFGQPGRVRMSGPTGDTGLDLVNNARRLEPGHVDLIGKAQHMRSAGAPTLTREGHRVLTTRAWSEEQVIPRGERPITRRVVKEEGEVLHMVVAVVGQHVENHATENSQHVLMVSR